MMIRVTEDEWRPFFDVEPNPNVKKSRGLNINVSRRCYENWRRAIKECEKAQAEIRLAIGDL